ncbi:MAG: hypothetical protein V3V00_11910 [Saprospiraceae bacterium]
MIKRVNQAQTNDPNVSMLGGQPPIRCVGCSVSGSNNNCAGENTYKVSVYYKFNDNVPTNVRRDDRDGYDVFE